MRRLTYLIKGSSQYYEMKEETMYNRGDLVHVVGFQGKKAVLRVWEVRKRGAILLTEDMYQKALEGEEINVLGFSWSDIKGLVEGARTC